MTNPWETTELPEPVPALYDCPGPGWHSIDFHYPEYMRWMQGVPGTDYTEDDYYCDSVYSEPKEYAGEGKRPEVVLGPTLSEELERRHTGK